MSHWFVDLGCFRRSAKPKVRASWSVAFQPFRFGGGRSFVENDGRKIVGSVELTGNSGRGGFRGREEPRRAPRGSTGSRLSESTWPPDVPRRSPKEPARAACRFAAHTRGSPNGSAFYFSPRGAKSSVPPSSHQNKPPKFKKRSQIRRETKLVAGTGPRENTIFSPRRRLSHPRWETYFFIFYFFS